MRGKWPSRSRLPGGIYSARKTMQTFTVLYESGKRNWSAYVPDLPGCIVTGKTRKRVERLIRQAIEFHVEGLKAHGEQVPEPTIEVGTVSVSME
jgi:predicted RNase H-like HicB family nuclease